MKRAVPLVLLLGCPPGDVDPTPAPRDDDDLFAVDDDDAGADPIELPPAFRATCDESEPNDPPVALGELTVAPPPWEDADDCGSVPPGDGAALHIRGAIADIVEGTWDGDNDAFSFVVDAPMTPSGVLQWDPLQGDLDAQIHCERDGGLSRLFAGGLASAEVPETADAEFEIPAGATCWVFVSGFAGRVAAYDLWLE